VNRNENTHAGLFRRAIPLLLLGLGLAGSIIWVMGPGFKTQGPDGDMVGGTNVTTRAARAAVDFSPTDSQDEAIEPPVRPALSTATPDVDMAFDHCLDWATKGDEVSIRQLVASLMNEGGEDRRYKLVQTLQAVTNTSAAGILFDALTNRQVNGCFLLALVDAVPRLATAETAGRLVESCRDSADDGDGRRDWLLQVVADLRGDGVMTECGSLLNAETNGLIQAALTAALLQDGRPEALDAVVEKIETSGTTNREDQLVVMLSGVSQDISLGFLMDEFQSTTNPVIKWAVGSALSRLRHLDQAAP
jgi:hypothetical protein